MAFHPFLLRILLLMLTSTAWAQEQPQDADEQANRWYQIEVVVFSQKSADQGQEQLHSDISLSYPSNYQLLKAPLTAADINSSTQYSAVADESSVANNPSTDAVTPANRATDLETDPFYFLPTTMRQLSANARAMAREGRQILFHEAWRQPLTGANTAPALIISGGDKYGNHNELEGSISISVSRYLHLQTNLWLTSFVRNYGTQQDNEQSAKWPTLPLRPDLQASLTDASVSSTFDQDHDAWQQLAETKSVYEKLLDQPYITNRIALLQQKRRMRSGELHYIDHPTMGLLIKITPYQPVPAPAANTQQTVP